MVVTSKSDLPPVVVTSGARNEKLWNIRLKEIAINWERRQNCKTMVVTLMIDIPSEVVTCGAVHKRVK